SAHLSRRQPDHAKASRDRSQCRGRETYPTHETTSHSPAEVVGRIRPVTSATLKNKKSLDRFVPRPLPYISILPHIKLRTTIAARISKRHATVCRAARQRRAPVPTWPPLDRGTIAGEDCWM